MGLKVEEVFNGSRITIYYVSIDDFVGDLEDLGRFLEEVSSKGRIVSIIPNIGLTKTSLLLGTSFQGVKGFAVIVEKK